MNNKMETNLRDAKLRQLLDYYLQSRLSSADFAAEGHLDEDSFAAFVEGNLSENQASLTLTHLVDCGFCRRISAELIKLNDAFAEDAELQNVSANAPSKVSEVLNSLLSRIFTGSENAVFAHHDTEENSGENEEKKETENDKK